MPQKKVTGKVVKIRKSRRTPPINKKLIIALVITAVVIASTYGFVSTYQGGTTPTQTLKPYEVIERLAYEDNITAVLIYIVSGNLKLEDKVLGVYDRLIFLIQPATMQLPSNVGEGENTTIRYYMVRYNTEHYLTNYLLNMLGTTSVVKNLSDILVDEWLLRLLYENITTTELGRSRETIQPLGDVEVQKLRVEANSTAITISREVLYGLPVEITYSKEGSEVKLRLSDVIKY